MNTMTTKLPPPSETADNGKGREGNGRFSVGNRLARGNPNARKVARFRSKLFSSVTIGDFAEVVQTLLSGAKNGEPWAVKLFLAYYLGEPLPVDVMARLENLEILTEQRK